MNHWMWPVSLVGILSTAVVCGTDMFFLIIGRLPEPRSWDFSTCSPMRGQLGRRSGNWLSLEQSTALLNSIEGEGLRRKRDYAVVATLLGCGLRRSEIVELDVESIQQRQDHWVIVDLIGKGGHIPPCPSLDGPRRLWTAGSRQPQSPGESSFVRSIGMGRSGGAASAKTWCGASSEGIVCVWGLHT
jgi:hypothetical protein